MAEAAIQPAETQPQVQVRRTIHVSREMGLGAVLIFSISSIGLIYSGLLPYSTLAGMWPGTNLAGMIAVGALVSLIITYTFAAIGTIAPRYGADYIVASRVVSPPLAFASSWTLVIFLALAGGSVVVMVTQNLIPVFSQSFALILFDKSMLSVMDWAASPSGAITIGTVGVILIFLALIAPSQVTHRVLLIGSLLAIITWIVICVILATTTPAVFQGSWDRFMGDGNFSIQLSQAQGLGLKLDFSTGTILVAGFMLSLWVFSGAFNPVYFASEVKDPKKNLLVGSVIALVVAMTILATTAVLLQRLVPSGWLSAESFLYQSSANNKLAMPWLPFYVGILRPNALLIRALGLSWVFSLLTMAHTFLYTSSRIVLAWGEDHLIPPGATFIHPELRSPLITVLIVCLLAEVGVVETALNTGIDNRINPVFFFAVVELLPAVGITLLPFIRRNWFLQSSGFLRARIGPLPLISIIGGLTVVYLVGMVVALVIWPGYNPLNGDTLVVFAILFASGLAWFYGRRFFLIKQGKDIDTLLRSAPEE
jgi:APA family basic amino acid/polyamine antiporter